MAKKEPLLQVFFYKSDAGNEPVRDWLRGLSKKDKKIIGEDIKTVQFGWPIGMPVVRALGKNLHETRSDLENRIARILFTLDNNIMVLLHGFIKKARKTPKEDLAIARKRMSKQKKTKGGD